MLLATATAGVMFAGSALASTLDDVRARGKLNCIINTGLAGFAAPDDKGKWTGFDVDFCRADPANITPAVAVAKSILIFILYLHVKFH